MTDVEVEVFFEDDKIILEMHDLELVGHGMVRDPEMGHLEILEFNGPISTGNIIINPEEVLNELDEMFPRFGIEEVNIVLDKANTIVMAHG